MSRPMHWLVPGSLDTPTGGYRYDRRIVEGLRAAGADVHVHRLDDAFPDPGAAALDRADATFAALPDGALVVADGLAFGALPEVAERHAARLALVALVHHPLHLETGLGAPDAERHRRDEARALACARRTVVTSDTTADAVAAMGVPREALRTVPPGTDSAPPSTGSADGVPNLLCVATITPRKDHATLVDALARLRSRAWRMVCVGSPERDAACARALRERIAGLGLRDRIELAGELDDDALAQAWATADACVLSSRHEGHGMVIDEAIARGLPVIATAAGAVPRTAPSDAVLLVPPGDDAALADALARWLDDADLRARLRIGALDARTRLRTWDVAATGFAVALEGLSP